MTSTNIIVVVVAILISVITSWFPAVRKRFDAIPTEYKGLAMIALMVIAALVVFAAGCTGYTIPGADQTVACDTNGARVLGQALIAAIVSNQLAFLMLPKPEQIQ